MNRMNEYAAECSALLGRYLVALEAHLSRLGATAESRIRPVVEVSLGPLVKQVSRAGTLDELRRMNTMFVQHAQGAISGINSSQRKQTMLGEVRELETVLRQVLARARNAEAREEPRQKSQPAGSELAPIAMLQMINNTIRESYGDFRNELYGDFRERVLMFGEFATDLNARLDRLEMRLFGPPVSDNDKPAWQVLMDTHEMLQSALTLLIGRPRTPGSKPVRRAPSLIEHGEARAENREAFVRSGPQAREPLPADRDDLTEALYRTVE
jgi:hypothetical protein